MAFELIWLDEPAQAFEKLRKAAEASVQARRVKKKTQPGKVEGLFKQVTKCVNFLSNNPRHPGLQTHEFHSLD